MNANVVRALFLDIVHQTFDNRMFRMLVVLILVLLLPTYLVGFQKDAIDILFGWKRVSYEELFSAFGQPQGLGYEPAQMVIRIIQDVFVSFFAGTLGLLFCVAATSFFLPNVLEKGAAENVFAKPISRATVLAARYFAGIFFVALLSGLLVVGMHVGFKLRSGYSDPGFLFSIVTLVYLYAILHAVSICIGVVTKNSVTAALGTILFFALNGCVQKAWVFRVASGVAHESREGWRGDPKNKGEEEGSEAQEKEQSAPLRALVRTLTVAHYVLPKTTDADVLSQKLQRSLESTAALSDPETKYRLRDVPAGFERDGVGDLAGAGVRWSRKDASGAAEALLRRIPRRVEREGEKRPRYLFPSSAAADRSEQLAALGFAPQSFELTLPREGRATSLAWPDERAGRQLEAHYFTGGSDWLYVLELSYEHTGELAPPDASDSLAHGFLDALLPPSDDPENWYADRMRWGGPLATNLWFSVLSTLGFVVVVLAYSWFRLSRTDF